MYGCLFRRTRTAGLASLAVALLLMPCIVFAAKGMIVCPVMSGKPDALPFADHPGWIDVYAPGDSTGKSMRIEKDASFHVGGLPGKAAAIASFDHIEALPIIATEYPASSKTCDLSIWGDYICVPSGYPDKWDAEYAIKSPNVYQTFIARSSNIYRVTAFDGPKVIDWGNKINVSFYEGGPYGEVLTVKWGWGEISRDMTGHHTDHTYPSPGWRHGDIQLTPGRRYAVRAGGYNSHSGAHFEMPTFARPDKGDGYPFGQAYLGNPDNPIESDLCLIIQGDSNGQIVENNVRCEEWDVRLPKHAPVTKWGQSFTNHGRSLAGIVFWASEPSSDTITCKVRIREDGPDGKVIGPTKTAVGHRSSKGPFIRYPNWPGPMEGYEEYFRLTPDDITGDTETGYYTHSQLFQAAYPADEVSLEPNKTYYVDLEFSKPVLVVVDGDYYTPGFGYYDGRKMEKDQVFHSDRWSIAGMIVTYANPGGAPNR